MIPFDFTRLTDIRPAAPPEGPPARLPENRRPFEDYLTSAGRESSARREGDSSAVRRSPDSEQRPAERERSSAESPPPARSAPEAESPVKGSSQESDRKPDSGESSPAAGEKVHDPRSRAEASPEDEPSSATSLPADGPEVAEHPGDESPREEPLPQAESGQEETVSADQSEPHSEIPPVDDAAVDDTESSAAGAVSTTAGQAGDMQTSRQSAAQGVSQAEAVQVAFKPATIPPYGHGETAVPSEDAEPAGSAQHPEGKRAADSARRAENRAGEAKSATAAPAEVSREKQNAEPVAGSAQPTEKPARDTVPDSGRDRRAETGREVRRQSAASPNQPPSAAAQSGTTSAAGEELPAAPVTAASLAAPENGAGEPRDPAVRPASAGEPVRGSESPASGSTAARELPPAGGGNRAPASLLPPGSETESESTRQSPQERVRFVQRVARAFEAAQQRGGEIRLRLSPPELGQMRLEISVRQGVLVARLETETPEARQVLLDNLPQLRERLAEQSIKVEKFDVDLRDQSRGDSAESRSEQARRQAERANRLPTAESASAETPQPAGPTAGSDQLNVVI